MENIQKIIFFAVGLIVTIGFISVGIGLYNKAKDTTSENIAQTENILGKLASSSLSFAKGDTVTGAEVIEALEALDQNTAVTIKVATGLQTTPVPYTSTSTLNKVYDKTNDNYINPSLKYTVSEITVNKNGILTGITFTQTTATPTKTS